MKYSSGNFKQDIKPPRLCYRVHVRVCMRVSRFLHPCTLGTFCRACYHTAIQQAESQLLQQSISRRTAMSIKCERDRESNRVSCTGCFKAFCVLMLPFQLALVKGEILYIYSHWSQRLIAVTEHVQSVSSDCSNSMSVFFSFH